MKNKIKNFARGRKFQARKIKSFNAPIIANSKAKSQAKYKQIVDIFRHSGGHDEAETYLIYWGVMTVNKDLLLAYAEYDALLSGGVE